MTAQRSAWLDLNGIILPLDDLNAGYICTSLDLGFPQVREVMNNRPDQNGVDDRTQFMGSRIVAAAITAFPGGTMGVDQVTRAFMPYLVASARPVLHYILLENSPIEKTLVLRASNTPAMAAPMVNPSRHDLLLTWVSIDSDSKSAVVNTVTCWAGSSVSPGRLYTQSYNKVYPVGGSAPTTGVIAPAGDLFVLPKVRIYGPITAPRVQFAPGGAGQPPTSNIIFLPPFIVNAGHFVDVDTRAKTVYMDADPTKNMVAMLDWQNSTWPSINPVPPAAAGVNMNLYGGSTSVVTQAQAIWQDRYLS